MDSDEFEERLARQPLLSRKYVAERLRAFRESRFVGNLQRFQAGKRLSGWKKIEDAEAFPQWPSLIRFIVACGSSLSELAAHLEPEPQAESESDGVTSPEEKRRLHEMLATIIRSNNPRRIQGITVNLEDISAAAKAEMDGTPARSRRENVEVKPPGLKTGTDRL